MINNSSEIENEYKSFFPNYQLEFTFNNWLIEDGSYVEKGDYVYEYSNSVLSNAQLIGLGVKINLTITKHRAEKSGYIDLYFENQGLHIPKNQLMYFTRDNDQKRADRKFINVPTIVDDEFDNSTKIMWEKVSSIFSRSEGISSKSDDLKVDFLFTINYQQNNDYIIFHFSPKQIKPKQNDRVLFLFNNKEIIEFELTKNPSPIKNSTNNKILESKLLITRTELNLFLNEDLKKWKIILKKDNREIIGGEIGSDKNYRSKNNLKIAIKKFVNEYVSLVKKTIPNYQPLLTRKLSIDKVFQTDHCFVYLMHDTSNGYYKIGISNKPHYREKTLQSEKPTIELIESKKFPIRKIAKSFEKSLHLVFAEKRIRGEWFELNEIDVEHLINSLK